MKLVLATTNSHKIQELQNVLTALRNWEVVPQPAFVKAVEETGATFLDNATLKALGASSYLLEDLVLADDSGLCVDALDGRPGVMSNRYAETDRGRIERLLSELQDVPESRRTASFVCVLVLARAGEIVWTVEQRIHGSITRFPAGSNGFGYDPIFWIPELGRTMADLSMDEKNKISHRGLALKEFVNFLRTSSKHFLM